jgi:hypothetical protein
MGPGISTAHRGLGLEKRGSAAAFGSIYTRLAIELSTGQERESWDPPRAYRISSAEVAPPSTPPRRNRSASSSSNDGGRKLGDKSSHSALASVSVARGRPRVACLHMTWRRAVGGVKWPGGKLKQVSALADAADDIVAAADYLRDKHGDHLKVRPSSLTPEP